jgi:hypothetical protein
MFRLRAVLGQLIRHGTHRSMQFALPDFNQVPASLARTSPGIGRLPELRTYGIALPHEQQISVH